MDGSAISMSSSSNLPVTYRRTREAKWCTVPLGDEKENRKQSINEECQHSSKKKEIERISKFGVKLERVC